MEGMIMVTTSLRTFFEAIKSLLRNSRALAIFAGLYAVLLATLYGFVATREATVWQVVVTLLFLVLIPAEFFILQSAIVTHARDSKFQWVRILSNSVKLAVVAIPIILLGYGLFILLNKWKAHYPQPAPTLSFPIPPGPAKAGSLHWPTLLFATLQGLLFGVALPLATIHLWIEVASHDLRVLVAGGAKPVVKRIGNVFARAFASESVLTYALGLIVFAAIPYAVLFVRIPLKGTKADFAVFIAQLVLAFVFTLVGWIATAGALARTNEQATSIVSPGEARMEAEAPA
jgi:hypothetical protein